MERQLRAILAQNQMLATRLSALENLVVTARIPPDWVTDPAPDGGGFGGGITAVVASGAVELIRSLIPHLKNWANWERYRLNRGWPILVTCGPNWTPSKNFSSTR
ncbi:hypothetical protein GV827_07160 [Sulfitobacter sp. JBTF-M27]|uniref:Uncharacterized protein n=1 Tax=Sulfitobacter sediminilitoris TaxID=2698830 RepID=A0A6P0C8J5_9RHOB|nr:hypothetical protein [Sulfitobacter sediminilitoris]NEK22177.1 hypothetical protein [Sulfitobacter sediminilitoris]